MADITNPEAVKFCNEVVRPMAELARAFVAKTGAHSTEWFSGINSLFPNDASPVLDGREDEGVSRLTGANVNSLMGVLIAMAGQSNAEIVSKPCVRAIQVS